MNVPAAHARMVDHVWIQLIHTAVSVPPVIQVLIVKQVSVIPWFFIDAFFYNIEITHMCKAVFIFLFCTSQHI